MELSYLPHLKCNVPGKEHFDATASRRFEKSYKPACFENKVQDPFLHLIFFLCAFIDTILMENSFVCTFSLWNKGQQ